MRFIIFSLADDGKSILIGSLLYDNKMILKDQLPLLETAGKKIGTKVEIY